ncbi:hypothetical protein DUI87_29851 [Hirundo rustica rustica]|uniref:Uncharacterized protein n=1 Tax=Hirundo rustica rustica TaxID=333673 RepID=A0A3M0IYE3_HIRRU|nr:hypothetical protein DUI87_29851 [Hirundo rustica rustica]
MPDSASILDLRKKVNCLEAWISKESLTLVLFSFSISAMPAVPKSRVVKEDLLCLWGPSSQKPFRVILTSCGDKQTRLIHSVAVLPKRLWNMGAEKKHPFDDSLSGNVIKYLPQASTSQKEGLQMSRDIWDDGEGVEFQEKGSFEARKPPDISVKCSGIATTAVLQTETSFSSSVLGNMPKSTGNGKADDKEKDKIPCCNEETRIAGELKQQY